MITNLGVRSALAHAVTGRSVRACAKEIGVSAPYLAKVLAGESSVGPKVLAWLGIERGIEYRRIQPAKELP